MQAFLDCHDRFEAAGAALRELLDLPWDEAIGSYRSQARDSTITTPSYRDVTAPISDRAVARWKAYESEMKPILTVLEPYVETFGYSRSDAGLLGDP